MNHGLDISLTVLMAVMVAGCIPVKRVWEEVIPLDWAATAQEKETFAREFVSRERYDKMRAVAMEEFDLTAAQSHALFLRWRRSGPFGGPQEVALVVGMVYTRSTGQEKEIVGSCKMFIERELKATLGERVVTIPRETDLEWRLRRGSAVGVALSPGVLVEASPAPPWSGCPMPCSSRRRPRAPAPGPRGHRSRRRAI